MAYQKSYVAHILSNKNIDTSFKVVSNNTVYSLVKDGSKLYMAGAFTSINSTDRHYLAAVNASTGVLQSWDPVANNAVNSIVAKDTVILAGGNFTLIGGKHANYFAAISKASGKPVGGFMGCNYTVNKINLSGDSILTGGSYSLAGYYSGYSTEKCVLSFFPEQRCLSADISHPAMEPEELIFPQWAQQIRALINHGARCSIIM